MHTEGNCKTKKNILEKWLYIDWYKLNITITHYTCSAHIMAVFHLPLIYTRVALLCLYWTHQQTIRVWGRCLQGSCKVAQMVTMTTMWAATTRHHHKWETQINGKICRYLPFEGHPEEKEGREQKRLKLWHAKATWANICYLKESPVN